MTGSHLALTFESPRCSDNIWLQLSAAESSSEPGERMENDPIKMQMSLQIVAAKWTPKEN